MFVRRLCALSLFALVAALGVAACTVEGAGAKSQCEVSGCTVTFDRGVNAEASILGVKAELVAVNGDTVTLKVAGQQVDVPVGETKPADGLAITVREVNADNVVVRIDSGLQPGNS
ncbi:hypothetical protein [Nocardia blacklockiae]|uniref:hypothetical protein n=1 Tax=Nocardia blacklockiae TaxID=480036 RepID=UPI001893E0F8|nr:hypothetical protein [Nocardia blacklockiae]MBF6171215.1 hypothetical protein [Nocardia blacklockiae]